MSENLKHLAIGIAVTGLALTAVGCSKGGPIPTEKKLVAKAPVAPGLNELEPKRNANRLVYRGDVYTPLNRFADFRWEGDLEGEVQMRVGAIEATRGELDGHVYIFGNDFIEADVPTSDWLCSKMGSPVVQDLPCPKVVRRTVASKGKLVAFIPCALPSCPLAELNDGIVTSTTVAGLSDARVVFIGQHQVALAWSRWVKSSDWTGGELIVMLLTPSLLRIGAVPLEEIDARQPTQVTTRMGALQVRDDGLRFTGRRAVVDRQNAKELSVTTFDERYSVTPDGKFVKQ